MAPLRIRVKSDCERKTPRGGHRHHGHQKCRGGATPTSHHSTQEHDLDWASFRCGYESHIRRSITIAAFPRSVQLESRCWRKMEQWLIVEDKRAERCLSARQPTSLIQKQTCHRLFFSQLLVTHTSHDAHEVRVFVLHLREVRLCHAVQNLLDVLLREGDHRLARLLVKLLR